MDRNRLVTLATKAFAAALFVLSALGLVVAVRTGDGIVSAGFAVYLTALLLGGVLRDTMDTRNWQVAFFGGVALWGGYEYATAGDLFSLLLAVLGVVMVAANLLELR
ncbi:hypothetical protein M0R88_03300 [Halorussus gelatinilyticus]|uniref:Uncharacterized protein n=1 Tax=Halorussus gelatinilyticus TaxID=2937524 RepID=A0A8U0IKD1_9EURY|nr:hypothetical protein [Halorussus gelatinilyticus]UPW01136.1 hypothetical protein M0R88_03300 [Halorussus gelatinilyticus]